MKRKVLGVALAGLLALAAPGWAETPTAAQPPLPKEALVIVTHSGKHDAFSVEVARTPSEQETGLMFRTSVSPEGGMLFIWKGEQDSQMWMKNTLVPLDMVFIGGDGTVKAIVENTVPESLAIIDSQTPVHATLELAGGTAARLDIRVGDKVECKALGTGS